MIYIACFCKYFQNVIFFTKRTVSHLTPMMVHRLKKAGFDGATGSIDNIPGGEEVVVFSPEQVKRI